MKRFLNVGGNSKQVPVPEIYRGWQHLLLDIDPTGKPDIVCDARELGAQDLEPFDAVYCAHNLEHYYQHDVPKVLAGFNSVLKAQGFVDIRVPDMEELLNRIVNEKIPLEAKLYDSPAGPITPHDVIYGLGRQIERSGEEFFAHKCGFTPDSLNLKVREAGFPYSYTKTGNLEIRVIAFKVKPDAEQRAALELPEGY